MTAKNGKNDPEQAPEALDPVEMKENVRNYLKFLKKAGFLYLVPSGEADRSSAHSRAECLEALRVECIQCVRCRLSQGRTHVVFGEGNPDADVMFVGEAPGAQEDKDARPFVGRAGKLLNSMMEEVGLRREDVFIANIIKCRPPDNRDPEPDEIETCEPYLVGQIDLIQPKVIVTLGRFAAHTLTQVSTPITRMRGQFFLYNNVKLMPTLHPAAVLRRMTYRADVVSDLRRAAEAVYGDGDG